MDKPAFTATRGETVARLTDIATRNVVQLDEACPLSEAAALMARLRISSIIVTDHCARPLGIITEQIILRAMQSKVPSDQPLRQIMSFSVITVPDDMECHEAYLLCLREGNQHLVLVDQNGAVSGLVCDTDFRLHIALTTISGRRSAASVMTNSVLSLPPESDLSEALDLLREQGGNCLVVTRENIPVGVITGRDVVRLYHQEVDPGRINLGAVMSSPVKTIALNASLSEVAECMLQGHLRHLVVVDHRGFLAGLVTEHDLTQIMVVGVLDSQINADWTFLKTLLDSIPDLVWLKDPKGVYLACNQPFEQLYGESKQGLLGHTDFDFVDPEVALALQARDREAVQSAQIYRYEEWKVYADGVKRGLFETIKTPVKDRHGKLIGVLGIARDITQRKQDEQILADSQALLNAVIDSTDSFIWSVQADTLGLLTFNLGLRNYFRTWHQQPIATGMRPEDLFSDADCWRLWHDFYGRALKEGGYSIEYTTFSGDITLQLSFNLLYRDQKVFGISVFGENITQRKLSEARIQYLAYHDILTQLPNHTLALERFNIAASYAARANSKIALLLLDLDNFKTVNDALGHKVGDGLLQVVAKRLTGCVRAADTTSKLGGDGFLMLLTDIHDLDDVVLIANEILNRVQEPVEIQGHSLSITVSIGIAIYPNDASDMEGLMKRADTALYVVKDCGRNDFRFFDETFNTATVEALNLKNELRLAVEKQEFVLHYQPQLDLASGRLIGAEALIRWNSPSRGLVAPSVFIPLAEDSGLIVQIGAWVLFEACRQAAEWRATSWGSHMTMAVNLSAVQFLRGNVEASVMAALEQSGLDPQALELELTESTLVKNPDQVCAILQRIKLLGISLSIDDFGTGYSSLSYLKRFPIDKLKVDQSFVFKMTSNVEDAEIVRATILMAHALGLKTTAEGIENETTAEHLRIFHCDEAQGFHFARPLTAEDFVAFALKRAG